ncbi:forespore capture DNA-binding protein RefZ [Bacillus sp. T33-2]|uniref:forespore capture DNA-binding protein RefZ n=1 Tax=Bacillus sp. T33-2 TaxID=2054168 RepID=UPI000C7930FE|nr:forespore capture DNA-binding protein RefZ [Bacillus sp. T33-2]PLR98157.1 TetR family transcriptional regulator [Bacillus sp. T33-2]
MRRNSKDKIVEAAIFLFNTKGFTGTSIRDIAARADVNVANIAYYFNNKQGLLEYCFTVFFENYLAELEKGIAKLDQGAAVCLESIVYNLVKYQSDHLHLTRFILREMTIDSQIVREIMSTYNVKERFYFKKVIEAGLKTKEFQAISIQFVIIQLKGLLSMPFLNMHYLTEVLHVLPNEKYFIEKYSNEIYKWIHSVLCRDQPARQKHLVSS